MFFLPTLVALAFAFPVALAFGHMEVLRMHACAMEIHTPAPPPPTTPFAQAGPNSWHLTCAMRHVIASCTSHALPAMFLI